MHVIVEDLIGVVLGVVERFVAECTTLFEGDGGAAVG
jgi:hypothetical protein